MPGQAFLLSKNIKVIEHRILVNGRLHTLKCDMNKCTITIANVYAPNSDNGRKIHFEILVESMVSDYYRDRIIIGGNFNNNLERLDKFGGLATKSKSRTVLREIISIFDFIDIWREKHKGIKIHKGTTIVLNSMPS